MARKKRMVDTVDRTRIGDAYIANMTTYLQKTRNVSKHEAEAFIVDVIKKQAVFPKMKVVETIRPGEVVEKTITFKRFIDLSSKCVMSPSGSLYKPVNVTRSFVSQLIKEGLAMRKVVKGKMFKALADGAKDLASKFKAEQNTIKVKLNALPGGFGSPSNLFYDKGGYNAVTSTSRMLISNSFTCCEQLLGGNLPLFNVEEVYNLITIAQNYGPSKKIVDIGIDTVGLKRVSVDTLLTYLTQQIHMYDSQIDLEAEGIRKYLNAIPEHIVQFIYYHGNLQHLIFNNEELFRPIIDRMFKYDPAMAITDDIIPDMYFKQDGDIMAIVSTVLAKEIAGRKPSVIVEEYPHVAKLCVAVHRNITTCLEELDSVFQCFIYNDVNFQVALHRRHMQRKAVVVSDTDSVIYTSADWAKWYVGHIDSITDQSYNIAALVTYWLSEANADTMAKYIIGVGAIADDVASVQMKNEFLYPALMLYPIKKVYAGIIKVQEGVVMAEPDPDIKGAAIRGLGASVEAKEFAKTLLVEDVLKAVTEGEISAITLIDKTTTFERKIWTSLEEGKLTYLPIASVNMPDDYADPDRTAYFYAKAWNYIFGEKYGEIRPPDKLPLVKITKPNELYFAKLKTIDVKIHDKFVKFIEDNGKAPSAFFIEPNQTLVPEELRPLINIRTVVYFNLNPVYLTLASLNIGIGHSKEQLLLGDIYKQGVSHE